MIYSLPLVTASLPWQLFSAVLIERTPTLTPEMAPIQRRMQDSYLQRDIEKSLKSDHEIKHEADLKR